MNEQALKNLAVKYGLPFDFVSQLWEKVTDKENFEKALQMFVAGTLKYNVATGNEPICIADIRKEVASNFKDLRSIVQKQMKEQERIASYYNGCKAIKYPMKNNKSPSECVFIKDGIIVAFARFDPKEGGIYAANNEVMPSFNWHPHEHLARLRQLNKLYYRTIKKAADKSPREWFDFNTIKQQ